MSKNKNQSRVKTPRDERLFWRLATLFGLIAWAGMIWSPLGYAFERGVVHTSVKWAIAAWAGGLISLLLLAIGFWVWFAPFGQVSARIGKAFEALQRLRWLNGFAAIIPMVIFPLLLLGSYGFLFEDEWGRAALLAVLALACGGLLKAAKLRLPWLAAGIFAALSIMAVYKAAVFLPAVIDTPLTLGWSEGSRYYYASLFFAPSRYGMHLPLPFLHPSRYLLQSLPFLIPGLSLHAHRIWQVLLWVGGSAGVAMLLAGRLRQLSRAWRWGMALWAFLFLFQGPVYYHLLACVAIILWGVRVRSFPRSLAAVIVASLWAGISRINWFPVPAMLAIAIYLIEVPFCASRGWLDYLKRPFVFAVGGMAAAFVAQAGYIALSGTADAGAFGSSFSSDLLWYRLFPSVTYPPGILPMTLLISAPLLVFVLNAARGRMHWLRVGGLSAMLLVLFAGGMVVSTKIGGGSNLHNMDAFFALLLMWGAYAAAGQVAPESERLPVALDRQPLAVTMLLVIVALMPIYPLISEGAPIQKPDMQLTWDDVHELEERIRTVQADGGRVLFIWQRQLITFNIIPNVALEPDYETVELMEMAMSGNQAYLDQFISELRAHKFALIVAGTQNTFYKDANDGFPEENNVWVDHVSIPLLTYYESSQVLPYSGIELFVPKP